MGQWISQQQIGFNAISSSRVSQEETARSTKTPDPRTADTHRSIAVKKRNLGRQSFFYADIISVHSRDVLAPGCRETNIQ